MKLQKRKGSPYFMAIYYDHSGNRIRKSTGTAVKKEAVQIATRWEYEASQEPAAVVETVSHPFSKLVERYRKLQIRDHGKSYEATTKYRIDRIDAYFSDTAARDIDLVVVEEYMDERLDSFVPHTTKKVSIAAVYREVSIIRAILRKAFKDGLLDKVPLLPSIKKLKGRSRWLTPEEENQLVNAVSGHAKNHLAPLIRLAVDTGGRSGELLGLDWRDVDLTNRRLIFRDTKNGEDRIIRLCKRAMAVLSSLGPKESGPVFTYQGESITKIRSAFSTARDKAGLADVHFHDLRHTFASRLVQNGVPLYDVMVAMGHKSLEMVQRYAHLAPDYQDRVVAALDGITAVSVVPRSDVEYREWLAAELKRLDPKVGTLFDTLLESTDELERLAS